MEWISSWKNLMIAILENYQQSDGSINTKSLKPYMGNIDKITKN